MSAWEPTLGAIPQTDGVRFRAWAPKPRVVELVLEGATDRLPMNRDGGGYWSSTVAGVGPGTRYGYVVDGEGPFPDPVSRFQPQGVHGLSEVVDVSGFSWTDADWAPPPFRDAVIYEMHVGTFSPEGTFAGAIPRLGGLAELGVTAVELMPLAAFPGRWNWGYDGVAQFAPFAGYGRPEDLCAFVDAAHAAGLAVILDVVYNHFGPDGNYTGVYSEQYRTGQHDTPWGDAINFDADGSREVRTFFRENILSWLHHYHVDGFRFDATFAIIDGSERHILAELAEAARNEGRPGIEPYLVAETHENDPRYVRPIVAGGLGFDAAWADDFHHAARTAILDEYEGYYANYDGSFDSLAACIRQGFLFEGQRQAGGKTRGHPARDVPWRSFVYCLQNHDQVGNRAFGDRLHDVAAHADVRALTLVLLLLPQVPMLFQGQEFFASAPFLYYTDHSEPLGSLVVEGRRKEFGGFNSFRDEQLRASIPSPQDERTFLRSKLNWLEAEVGTGVLARAFHRELLRTRHENPVLRASRVERGPIETKVTGEVLVLTIANEAGRAVIVLNLGPAASVALDYGAGASIAIESGESRFGGPGRSVELRDGRLNIPGHCAALIIDG